MSKKWILSLVWVWGLIGPCQASSDQPFRWAFQGDVNTLDPHFTIENMTLSFLGHIYEPLVSRDQTLKLVPALAQRWEQHQPTVWRFYLRRDVKFHNGNALTADDVLFTAKRIKAAPYGSNMFQHLFNRVEKVDDYTVDWHTDNIDPILPSQISLLYIVDEQWVRALSEGSVKRDYFQIADAHGANGTGPFRLAKRVSGVETHLSRHEKWWGQQNGNVQHAVFRPINSPHQRLKALSTGEVDFAHPIPAHLWQHLDEDPNLDMLVGMEVRTIFLGMDQLRDELLHSSVKGKNPFKDARVRRAMLLAVDRNKINRKIMRFSAHPTELMVSPKVKGYNPDLDVLSEYNPKKAWMLLKQAGYGKGFDITLDCPNNRYVNDEKICHLVSSMLARIGIRVTVNAMPKADFFAKVLGRNGYQTSFYLLGWTPDTMDAHSAIVDIMSCRTARTGTFNLGGYCNMRINELAQQVQSELDPERRQAMIDEIFRIHKDDVGHIPLHNQPLTWGVRRGFDLVQRADDFLHLTLVRVPSSTRFKPVPH